MPPKATKSANAFDLDALTELDEATLTVIHPKTGDPIIAADGQPWTIRLAGNDHPVTKKLRNTSIGKAFKAMRRAGSDDAPDAEQMVKDNIEALAARTLGWNTPILGEQEVAFSKEAAIDLYTRLPVLRNQVDAFLRSETSFLKGAASA